MTIQCNNTAGVLYTHMYLYQCYVTDPWLCDNPLTIEEHVEKAWNPDSQSIAVSTDSEAAASWDKVWVKFFDTDGNNAGDVIIAFKTEIQYYLRGCSTGFAHFSAALPTETAKTWTITYNHTKPRLVLHCNGVLVADVVLSSACAKSYWRDTWGKKPTHIQFYSDSASDSYCFSSNPGKYNGVIDSGE